MEFITFRNAMTENFENMVANNEFLFVTDTDRDTMWDIYLNSFPEEERQEHNCNCCRSFIKHYGNIVAITDGNITSIWDFKCEEPFQTVVNAMSKAVKSGKVCNIFKADTTKLGTKQNNQRLENGEIVQWSHLFLLAPGRFKTRLTDIPTILAKYRTAAETYERALREITTDAVSTVLELIGQGSLYRGAEFKATINQFLTHKMAYDLVEEDAKLNYCWMKSVKASHSVTGIRNSAIGTLLVNLSANMELDTAVSKYEGVVAPSNYKRPKSLITPKMIQKAEARINELGLMDSLPRRFSVVDDIDVNNVLYINRDVKKAKGIFDELKAEATVSPKNFEKVEEVTIDKFVKDILPNITKMEVFMESKLSNNLMSLISGTNEGAKPLFKWENLMSWAYNNDVTDSIKDQVVKAGGKVDGVLRASLSWHNTDDLDIHAIEPNGNEICFNNRSSRTSGQLDIDMNASELTTKPVENIIWSAASKMKEGKYIIKVNNFTKRDRNNQGYTLEIECNDNIYTYTFEKNPGASKTDTVVEFTWTRKEGIKLIGAAPKIVSTEIWGINTNQFHEVKVAALSPNFWVENTGNKHYFFILEGCKTPDSPRGFFNEYLKDELREDRKVFEVLGNKMRVEPSEEQLSGLGFSSTGKGEVIVRVEGKFKRVLKIKF